MDSDDGTGQFDHLEGPMELVLPFVSCVSKGGPYDDTAFTAGFQAGRLDQRLAVAAAAQIDALGATVYTDLIPQVDLIAMNNGYTMEPQQCGPPAEAWTVVVFTRTSDPVGTSSIVESS